MRAFAVAMMLTAFGPANPGFRPAITGRYVTQCPRGARPVDLRFVWIPPRSRRSRTLFDGPQRLLGVLYCSDGAEVITTP